jgi:hypothetical protein
MDPTRRLLISASAILPAACMGLPYERGVPVTPPKSIPVVRPPKVGQEWVYAKRDNFNSQSMEVYIERVAIVGDRIVISRDGFFGHRYVNEVQGPWGTIILDPHWGSLLLYTPPIPLWPEVLDGSWNKQIRTKYIHPLYPDYPLVWDQYMTALGWERITVPAGTFITLCFQNVIQYESEDDTITDAARHEKIWFSPSIGRWVARECRGAYKAGGATGYQEDHDRWELMTYK